MDGRPGFYLVTPLLLADGDAVLVQRGWLPRNNRDRTQLAPVKTPEGRVRIEARITPGPARLYEFEAAASGAIRQNLDIAAYAQETGLPPAAPGAAAAGQRGGADRRAAAALAASRARCLQAPRLCLAVVFAQRARHGSLCLVPTHPTAPPPALSRSG